MFFFIDFFLYICWEVIFLIVIKDFIIFNKFFFDIFVYFLYFLLLYLRLINKFFYELYFWLINYIFGVELGFFNNFLWYWWLDFILCFLINWLINKISFRLFRFFYMICLLFCFMIKIFKNYLDRILLY